MLKQNSFAHGEIGEHSYGGFRGCVEISSSLPKSASRNSSVACGRILRVVCIASACCLFLASPVAADPGDLNDDGSLNGADILLMQRLVRGDDLSGLTPSLVPHDLRADLAPSDSVNLVSIPDGAVGVADLAVLMARVRAGDTSIAQAPLIDWDGAAPPEVGVGETTQNPIAVIGAAESDIEVELFINGAYQQTATTDASGGYMFDAYLDDGVNDISVRSTAGVAAGVDSRVLQVDYYNPLIRSACTADPNASVILIPNTISSDLIISSNDEACNQSVVFRTSNSSADLSVPSGRTLAIVPGGRVELAGGQTFYINGGTVLGFGNSMESAEIWPDLGGQDAFGGINVRNGGTLNLLHADIVNPKQTNGAFGSTNRSVRVGWTTSDGGPYSASELENTFILTNSFLGYRSLSGSPAGPWFVDGLAIGPGNVVRIEGSELRGGRPPGDSPFNPGLNGATTIGVFMLPSEPYQDAYDVIVSNSTIANFKVGMRVGRVGKNHAAGSEGLRIENGSRFLSNEIGLKFESGSRASVDETTMEGNCVGLNSGSSSPVVEASTITGNQLGVELNGGATGTLTPVASIRGSDLSGNGAANSVAPYIQPTCTGTSGTLLSRLSRTNGSNAYIDLTGNHWGVYTAPEVFSTIQRIISVPVEENHVPTEVSGFLDAPFGVAIVGSDGVYSKKLFDLRFEGVTSAGGGAPDRHFVPRGASAQAATIAFARPVNLDDVPTVRVHSESGFEPGNLASAVVRTAILNSGEAAFVWDGRNDAGQLVASDAYVASVSVVGETLVPTRSSFPGLKLVPLGTTNAPTDGVTSGQSQTPINFRLNGIDNPIYRGGHSLVRFRRSGSVPTNRPYRLRLFAWRRLNVSIETCAGPPPASPELPDLGEFIFEGDASGLSPDVEIFWRRSTEEIASSQGLDPANGYYPIAPEEDRYCVRGDALGNTLYEPFVIVDGGTLVLSGGDVEQGIVESPSVAIFAEPYVLHRSYDQTVRLSFCVDREADVTVRVLNEGFNTDVDGNGAVLSANVKATLLDNVRLSGATCSAGTSSFHSIDWLDITEPIGTGAIHAYVIRAVTTESTSELVDAARTSVYRGILDLRP